jgi:peptide deformylase
MIIIKPHKNKSRKATDNDAQFIAEQASEMMLLAAKIEHDRKFFSSVFGIHHSQVCKKPIDFFVLNPTNAMISTRYEMRDSFVIINPEIINHTNNTVDSMEACLSFAGMPEVKVDRWNKITVRYQILVEQDNGSWLLSIPHEENIGSILAKIFQHEMDHGQAKYIYKNNYAKSNLLHFWLYLRSILSGLGRWALRGKRRNDSSR